MGSKTSSSPGAANQITLGKNFAMQALARLHEAHITQPIKTRKLTFAGFLMLQELKLIF